MAAIISGNPEVIGVAVLTVLSTLAYSYFKFNAEASNENAHYFKPQKSMAMKDTLIVKMLEENETKKTEGKAAWVITDPALDDNPIIYASEGFCRLTGYDKNEVENRNCRFLQGPKTDPKDVAAIRNGVEKKIEISACLLNYRKDGTTFVNQFFLCPLFGDDGKVAYYVGVQTEVPKRSESKEGDNIGWRITKWL